jgi:hypothetical protein
MAHCEICDLWLEPWQGCLHLKPVDDGGNRRADRNSSVCLNAFHSNACS